MLYKLMITGTLLFSFSDELLSRDTLSVEQCRQLALAAHPDQVRKGIAQSVFHFQVASLEAMGLPRVGLAAEATYQSDVFRLPIQMPLFEVPDVPRDQYRARMDVSQRIWDGQSDKLKRDQLDLDRELVIAQVDLDAFPIRETVTELFFRILLLQESGAIIKISHQDLERRLAVLEAGIEEGAVLRSSADQVRIQLIKLEQQLLGVEADRVTLLGILGVWIGRENQELHLSVERSVEKGAYKFPRPEWNILDLRMQQLEIQDRMVLLRRQPRIEAYAQGGIGDPNPFNFFDRGLFGQIGIRLQWTPVDWGVGRRDREIHALQRRNIEVQRQLLKMRMDVQRRKEEGEIGKVNAQLHRDDLIIRLQEGIVLRLDEQVKNGVASMTEYLAQLDLLGQSRLNRLFHELQRMQAQEMLIAKGE